MCKRLSPVDKVPVEQEWIRLGRLPDGFKNIAKIVELLSPEDTSSVAASNPSRKKAEPVRGHLRKH